jgi:hypothetical protein
VDYLFAMLALDVPQRQWQRARTLLRVPLAGSMRGVLRHHVALRDAIAVLPLPHGALLYPTWLLGLWAEMFAPQLEKCDGAGDAIADHVLVMKLGGDGTSGFKSHGAAVNIESLNAHPLSLTAGQSRAHGAAFTLGIALADEKREALSALWQPVVDALSSLEVRPWRDHEWRVLRLHTGKSLAVSLHIGGDGAFLSKLLGLASSLFRRESSNAAACLLCDASYDQCCQLVVGSPRTTASQVQRGNGAERQRAAASTSASRAEVLRSSFNTKVRAQFAVCVVGVRQVDTDEMSPH